MYRRMGDDRTSKQVLKNAGRRNIEMILDDEGNCRNGRKWMSRK